MIILDVGRSMSERTSTIEDSKKAISMFVQIKMTYTPKDEIGLLLVGTKDSSNTLNEEYPDEYQNITIAHPINTTDLDLYRIIEAIGPEGEEGDLIESILVAMDMLAQRTGTKKYRRRIFLFTDAGNPIKFHENPSKANMKTMAAILEAIKDKEVELDIIGVNFKDIDEEDENDNDNDNDASSKKQEKKLTLKEGNEQFLREKIIAPLDNKGHIIQVNDALANMSFFRSRSVAQRSAFRGCLDVAPNLKIPVWAFTKSYEMKFPTLKKQSAIALRGDEPGQCKIKPQRTYFRVDEPDVEVPDDKLVKAYRYGKSLIPFNTIDESSLKSSYDKCLKVLGFTEAAKVPRHHYMATCVCFVAKPEDNSAGAALSAFIHALAEMERVAIVRYVSRSNASPQLGFLAPYMKSDYECLYFNSLPFVEDLRQYPFRSFEKIKVSDSQLKAAESFINAFDLMVAEEDEDGDKIEALKISQTFNPVLQHYYQCLQFRALHPKDPLPTLDPQIAKYCLPEENPDSFLFKLVERNTHQIQEFAKSFPLKKIEKKTREKRKYWFATTDKSDEINLDSYIVTGGKDEENEEVEYAGVAKRLKTGDDINLDSIFKRGTSSVSTVNPVQDFTDMLNRKDEDLVEKAIMEMIQVVNKLLQESIGDQYFQKALDCINSLRSGCIKEDETNRFNDFIKQLKTKGVQQHQSKQGNQKHAQFWDLLRSNKVTLISEDESSDSTVSAEDANAFLVSEEPEEVVETQEAPGGTEEEDLFDMLE